MTKENETIPMCRGKQSKMTPSPVQEKLEDASSAVHVLQSHGGLRESSWEEKGGRECYPIGSMRKGKM